jgi:hypothetical protein
LHNVATFYRVRCRFDFCHNHDRGELESLAGGFSSERKRIAPMSLLGHLIVVLM